MPDEIDRIRADVETYRKQCKKQDITIYASKYVYDMDLVLAEYESAPAIPTTLTSEADTKPSAAPPGVSVRKGKASKSGGGKSGG